MDKFETFSMGLLGQKDSNVPILEAAYAAFECSLVDRRSYGDHSLFVGEIAAVYVREGAFTKGGTLDLENVRPTLYLGANLYVTTLPVDVRCLPRNAG